MTTIRRILLLLMAAMMLCMTSVPIVAQCLVAGELVADPILGGEDELMPMGANDCPPPTSIVQWSQHALDRMSERNLGQDYLEFVFQDAVPVWNSTHGTWNYTDGEITICVNPAGTVTTVYWNFD